MVSIFQTDVLNVGHIRENACARTHFDLRRHITMELTVIYVSELAPISKHLKVGGNLVDCAVKFVLEDLSLYTYLPPHKRSTMIGRPHRAMDAASRLVGDYNVVKIGRASCRERV